MQVNIFDWRNFTKMLKTATKFARQFNLRMINSLAFLQTEEVRDGSFLCNIFTRTATLNTWFLFRWCPLFRKFCPEVPLLTMGGLATDHFVRTPKHGYPPRVINKFFSTRSTPVSTEYDIPCHAVNTNEFGRWWVWLWFTDQSQGPILPNSTAVDMSLPFITGKNESYLSYLLAK